MSLLPTNINDVTRPRNCSLDSGHASGTHEKHTCHTGTSWQGKDSSRTWISAGDRGVHCHRTIVLCFDGTGDQFDADNSNVVQLMAMLRKDDNSKQVVYYQAGIGTYTSPLIVGQAASSVVKTLDEMLAVTLSNHIKEGYEFLMQNYTAGDKICIFGFSRGAYTARALAGMIQKVGLLSRDNRQQLPFAYSMYARDDLEGLQLSIMFKRTFSIDVKIEFLGVWETVASVGIVTCDLPFVGTNNAIRYFRHALALDEHRAKFIPNYYGRSFLTEKQETEKVACQCMPYINDNFVEEYEDTINGSSSDKTDAVEVWFAGAHCDVGGGSVKNDTRHSLARIPLRWMIRECFRTNTGIIFDSKMLQNEVGLDLKTISHDPPQRIPASVGSCALKPDPPRQSFSKALASFGLDVITFPGELVIGLVKPSRVSVKAHFDLDAVTPSTPFLGEAEEELNDALSPIYDELYLTWWWRILEWIPLRHKKQKNNGSNPYTLDEFVWTVNRGRGRKVFRYVMERGMKVHRSVKTRLEAVDAKGRAKTYVPRVRPKFFSWKAKRLAHERWDLDHPDFCEWVD